MLNPRGFVSPIADNALNYYNYKFLGSFFEDGKEVNTIKVIPKKVQLLFFTRRTRWASIIKIKILIS